MHTHGKEGNALIQKLDGLLRRLRLPRQLHHYGPKKYCLRDHLLGLLYRQKWEMSYREAHEDLAGLGLRVPTYSALCKMAKRMPLALWRALFRATAALGEVAVAAVDSTGMQLSTPSWHYVRTIDRKTAVRRPLKLSLMVDTRRKRVLAARLRSRPRGDARDVPFLLRHAARLPRILVADKGYDCEGVYARCFGSGILPMIPIRKGVRHGKCRRKAAKRFRLRTYNRRQMVESVFSALKRRFGASLSSRSWRAQSADLHARLIVYNLCFWLTDFFN